MRNLKDRTELYYDCAERHARLVRALDPPAPPPWWQFWNNWW
jgi:hypothetical protein